MTDLECAVQACAHWCSGLCRREAIAVGGGNARKKDETSCESFYPRSQNAENRTLSASLAGPCCEISCDAQRCLYNEENYCEAASVRIECCGVSRAQAGQETRCASFISRKS